MNHLFHRLCLTTLVIVLGTGSTFAQGAAPGWLEETMFRSGKINVVVAVVTVILAGLAIWMFRMDRRVKRMEDRTKP